MGVSAEQRLKWPKRLQRKMRERDLAMGAKGRAATGRVDWTPAETAEVRRLVKRGWSSAEIKAKFKGRRSWRTVHRWLVKLDLLEQCRSAYLMTEDERGTVLKLTLVDRWTLNMISAHTGIHRDTIRNFLDRRGVAYVRDAEYQAEKRKVGFVRGWLKAERGAGVDGEIG